MRGLAKSKTSYQPLSVLFFPKTNCNEILDFISARPMYVVFSI